MFKTDSSSQYQEFAVFTAVKEGRVREIYCAFLSYDADVYTVVDIVEYVFVSSNKFLHDHADGVEIYTKIVDNQRCERNGVVYEYDPDTLAFYIDLRNL